MAKTLSRRYKHAAQVAWRKIDEELVVLDLQSSLYYSLNPTASFAWQRLERPASAEELAAELSAEFDVAPARAAADAAELLETLLKDKLLVAA